MPTLTDKRPCRMTRPELRAEILATAARLADLDKALTWPGIGPATLSILAEGRVDMIMYMATLRALLLDESA